MKNFRSLYYNTEWFEFAKTIRKRDNNKCVHCGRNQNEIVLQVHHTSYIPGLKPWEYLSSECISLCKGCHAREHNLIEPSNGWTLIAIDDRGDKNGACERKGCNAEIRYEHLTYHPEWGYKIVGSTCIEYLTQEEKELSKDVIKIYQNIQNFVRTSVWEEKISKNGKPFHQAKFNHHLLIIYGTGNNFSYQIALKHEGMRWYKYQDFMYAKNKNLDQVKELVYIVLKGTQSTNEEEKQILRHMYSTTK